MFLLTITRAEGHVQMINKVIQVATEDDMLLFWLYPNGAGTKTPLRPGDTVTLTVL